MRPLCYGMRSHPYLLSLCSLSWSLFRLSLIIFPARFWFSLLHPHLFLDPWSVRIQLTPGNAMGERTNCPNRGTASASMNAISRERFIPTAVADAVTPTYLRARVTDFHPIPTYSIRSPWPYYPCCDSLPLPLERSASCTAYRPYPPPADGSGGWWSSAPGSAPVPPSHRLLERS